MRCAAYHELGHQRRLCITDKISCSLETPGRGSGSEGRQQGREKWKEHESACRTSAEFNTALHLAITALGASPDEKTTEQKKIEGYLKSWHLLPKEKSKPKQNETPASLQRRGTDSDSSKQGILMRAGSAHGNVNERAHPCSQAHRYVRGENLVSGAITSIHPSLQTSIRGAKTYPSLIKQTPQPREKWPATPGEAFSFHCLRWRGFAVFLIPALFLLLTVS